jgi:hypothetical protein
VAYGLASAPIDAHLTKRLGRSHGAPAPRLTVLLFGGARIAPAKSLLDLAESGGLTEDAGSATQEQSSR